MRYTLSPAKLIERVRRLYLGPIIQRDHQNRHESLNIGRVETRLDQLGVKLEPFQVPWQEFLDFQHQYAGQFGRWNKKSEKQLEYFISEHLLAPVPEDCLIDIGSWFSTYPDIIRAKYGCKVYAQDLSYPTGIHGWQIGGDAARLPLPDRSVSKIALHCTFEHFEGDADTRFVRELARVLMPKGRAVIVPLYIHQKHTIWTDPSLFASARIQPDLGASIYRNVGWSNSFGRHYSPEALNERILEPAQDLGLRVRILRVANIQDLDPRYYVRFIGVISADGTLL